MIYIQWLFIVGVVFITVTLTYDYWLFKKMKSEFNKPSMLRKAPKIAKALLKNEYALLAKHLEGLSICAFTQCDYVKSIKRRSTFDLLTHRLKRLVYDLVDVKENQVLASSYFVLSGEDLYYLTFVNGKVTAQLQFNQQQLSKSRIKKQGRLGVYHLSIPVNGKSITFALRRSMYDFPVQMSQFNASTYRSSTKLVGKQHLMILYFMCQMKRAYPNLTPL